MTIPAGVIKTAYSDGRAIYHLGTLFAGDTAVNLGPYDDNGVLVPGHWWNARWTYRTAPLEIKKSPAQIVSANRMFPYGDTGCKVPALGARAPYIPMGSSNITVYMPTTGERSDIGLITDNSAYFMLGGDPGPMIDWAQANDSCPLHFRDETTGRPIDLTKYPQANSFDVPGKQGDPWLDKGPPTPSSNGYHQYGGGWTPQQAHFCEMSYLAYQATLDAGFLENLQYNANFTVSCDATRSTPAGAIISGEYRGVSWAFRNLFMAHAATQDAEAAGTLPASCHPSSYWKKLLDNQLAFYSKFMADPANQYYRLVCGAADSFGPWQVDYMLTALAFGVLTGHSDWMPLYLWAFKNAYDRTSGKVGYPPGYGGAYYLPTAPGSWWGSLLAGWAPDQKPLTPQEIATLTADPLNGGKSMYGQEYLMTTREVIVHAQYIHKLGLADVKSVYPDLDLCFANVDRMVRNYGSMNPRQSVVLDASQVPDTIPPLPPINPQPPTEIEMSDTKLRIGETKHITLSVTPQDADQTGLAYVAAPDGLVTLAPDATGVAVTRVAAGTATIEADLNGLKATAEALDAAPLATALALSWDS